MLNVLSVEIWTMWSIEQNDHASAIGDNDMHDFSYIYETVLVISTYIHLQVSKKGLVEFHKIIFPCGETKFLCKMVRAVLSFVFWAYSRKCHFAKGKLCPSHCCEKNEELACLKCCFDESQDGKVMQWLLLA